MTTDPLRYDRWIEEALRGVIRRVLAYTSRHGLPGEHHFYITFRTRARGTNIPSFLAAQYPEEMTIVLQHRFEDLHVDDEAFSVSLFFNGREQRLRVPFAAITGFNDPAVNFGLQLKMEDERGALLYDDEEDEDEIAATFAAPPDQDGEKEAEPDKDAGSEDDKMGQVISIDAFRK